MNIPVTVERSIPPAADANAFLLPDHTAARLGGCVAELSTGTAPPAVYRVRGGWLLVPPSAPGVSPPGTFRLRRVAAHVYVPFDAALSPALLPDEFPGLTRGGGLVLLPSDHLAFDPAAPVPAASWLALPPRRNDEWAALPPPPAGADTLRVIERPAPPAAVADILRGGEPYGHNPLTSDIPDDARPPAGTFLRRVGAGAALGVAGVLAWLGRQLGASGLARTAAEMARRAIERVPRLSERVLGAQEAALRELLRQLKGGDVEKALRRAPVAVPDPDQRGTVSGGANLTDHDTRYSLADLIRGGGGAASIWAGGGDVWGLLQAEYRRLAEEAVKRGDYRRAAYLWGVLLRDLRTAANVLKAGGLYRDAARLLRDKLNDPTGAAAAFESAGDFDEAVRLYETAGEYLKAAELLRRIGDERRAEVLYLIAADELASRHEYVQAGDLVRTKLGRDDDQANCYYHLGWIGNRPDAITCGERLLDGHLVRGDADGFDRLLAEAEGKFAPPAADAAGRFFNYAVGVSAGFLPADRHAGVKDRVRLLLADHLRHGGSGRVRVRVDQLFGAAGDHWSVALGRDAAFAAAALPAAPVVVPNAKPVTPGKVQAAAYAPGGGVLFIGTEDTLTAWNVSSGVTRVVAQSWKGELLALCTDDAGGRVYGLLDQTSRLRLIALTSAGHPVGSWPVLASADIPCQDAPTAYLQPRCFADPQANSVVVAADGERMGYHAQMLTPGSTGWFDHDGHVTHWVGQTRGTLWGWGDGELIGWRRAGAPKGVTRFDNVWRGSVGWTPACGVGVQPMLDWAAPDDSTLVLAGIDADGVLHRSVISTGGAERSEVRHQFASDPNGLTALALLRGNRVAAVTKTNRVAVFGAVGPRLALQGLPVPLPAVRPVVFLFAHLPSDELLAVLDNGEVIRMPVPPA